mgnify:CR=1 FL=1
MRYIYLALIAALFSSPGAAATDDSMTCSARLERTLETMENRSPMKDEVATSLMWHRMDAQEAQRSGDLKACSAKMDVIENILNLSPKPKTR